MKKFIVSIASYPARYQTLSICLASIFTQTCLPDKVMLNVSNNHRDIPLNVYIYKELGLEINYIKDDLKCHNKYFYVMQEYQNEIVITLDDDCVYHKYLIENLLRSYTKFPNCISAGRAHKIKFDSSGKISPYLQWEWESNLYNTPSKYLMATGVGGVLYPPSSLPAETFNMKNIINLCLLHDDVWLKVMQLSIGTEVVLIKQDNQHPVSIPYTENIGLHLINKYQNGTDQYLENIINYYNIDWKRILEDEPERNHIKHNSTCS